MSQYATGTAKVEDPEALILALSELGYPVVDVYAEPVPLYGWHGDERPEKAHLVIRRRFIDASANDVGFLFNPDGSCTAIISQADRYARFNAKWLERLEQLCVVHRLTIEAVNQGQTVSREIDAETGDELVVVTGGWA